MDPHAEAILRFRTTSSRDWSGEELAAARDHTVSVVLPALNEQSTVGEIVSKIRGTLMAGPARLVDELVVLDSGSSDATGTVAKAAGATVLHRDEILARIPAVAGKGEAMWRAAAATRGDIVVFIDADLQSFATDYLVGLLGPLLTDPGIDFVKAAYDRPVVSSDSGPTGGGRVTELVARPLLNLYWPALAGVIQPLAGEYAVRRSLLERLPFPCGYGVDFALLVDALQMRGPEVFAQVDLGVRRHRHHDDLRLGRMSAEILQAAISRLNTTGHPLGRGSIGTAITQFERSSGRHMGSAHDVSALERPPLLQVPEYAARRQRVV